MLLPSFRREQREVKEGWRLQLHCDKVGRCSLLSVVGYRLLVTSHVEWARHLILWNTAQPNETSPIFEVTVQSLSPISLSLISLSLISLSLTPNL